MTLLDVTFLASPGGDKAKQISDSVSHWYSGLGGRVGAFGVSALVMATVILAFYLVMHVVGRPNRNLAGQLEPYRLHPEPPAAAPEGVVTLPALQRLAEVITNLADRRGLRDAAEARMVRAGLSISFGELMVVGLIGGVVLLALGGFVAGVMGFILALVIVVLFPVATLQFLGDRRTRAFDSQLPDVLKLLSATLRAGFSFLQGLDAVIPQVGEPMASELRQAFSATRVGLPVEDALEAAARRIGSRDFEWVVMAVRIQREVGGNLAEILDTVAATMTARVQLRRTVHTLTAEGRISAIILSAMPIVLGAMVFLINRPYIETLFNTLAGNVALLGGVLLEIVGGYWLYRTVQIEI